MKNYFNQMKNIEHSLKWKRFDFPLNKDEEEKEQPNKTVALFYWNEVGFVYLHEDNQGTSAIIAL